MPRYLGRGQIGICQRCGFKHKRAELVEDGRKAGLIVCKSCYDPEHPQDFPPLERPEGMPPLRPSPEVLPQPTAPVLSGELNDDQIDLEWTESTFNAGLLTHYTLFRNVDDAGFEEYAEVEVERDEFGAQTSDDVYTDEDIVAGSTYEYYVVAHSDQGGSSSPSNEVSFAVPLPPDTPYFVIVGASGSVLTSLDGIDWTLQTDGVNPNTWAGVAWASDIEKFVAVAQNGSDPLSMISDDAETWVANSVLSDNRAWARVARDPVGGLFAAVTDGGSGAMAATSPDGITWTQGTAQDRGWSDIAWSPTLNLFATCAIMLSSTTRIATSPTGAVWTMRGSSSSHNLNGMCWAGGAQNKFCAVGNRFSGVNNGVIWLSSDGITWTTAVDLNVEFYSDVAYSPSLDLFCATCRIGGTTRRVATSPDGVTWTLQTVPDTTQAWSKIAWSEELGLFAVVNGTGTSGTNRVMTSPDGVNWTLRTTPSNTQNWNDICARA